MMRTRIEDSRGDMVNIYYEVIYNGEDSVRLSTMDRTWVGVHLSGTNRIGRFALSIWMIKTYEKVSVTWCTYEQEPAQVRSQTVVTPRPISRRTLLRL